VITTRVLLLDHSEEIFRSEIIHIELHVKIDIVTKIGILRELDHILDTFFDTTLEECHSCSSSYSRKVTSDKSEREIQ
jgi:hypothetical protein